MATIIPEIRIYSPSDRGDDTSDEDKRMKALSNDPLYFSGLTSNLDNSSGRVPWLSTFNMRPLNLSTFTNISSYRSSCRSQSVAMQRAKLGCVTSSAKSLDILRQNLQRSINREIDEILQRYLEKFFKPGIENIRVNNGVQSVSDQHIQAVCRQILEEAKKMYHTRGDSPFSEFAEWEPVAGTDMRSRGYRSVHKKRKESDTDSEASQYRPAKKKKKGRPPLHYHGNISGRSTPSKLKADSVKREGPKWDPARLVSETQFIMGAKANKALGLGATRGRLYIKHPDVFKYSGDQEDKQWLYDHNLMPATGGKAYMLLVEDIKELAESDEYRTSPGLMLDEIVGFAVPENILQKMRVAMQSMRTDVPNVKKRGGQSMLTVDTASDRSSNLTDQKSEELNVDEKLQDLASSRVASPADDLDVLSAGVASADPSPFSLGPSFEDVSPAPADISPAPSDISNNLDPNVLVSIELGGSP